MRFCIDTGDAASGPISTINKCVVVIRASTNLRGDLGKNPLKRRRLRCCDTDQQCRWPAIEQLYRSGIVLSEEYKQHCGHESDL